MSKKQACTPSTSPDWALLLAKRVTDDHPNRRTPQHPKVNFYSEPKGGCHGWQNNFTGVHVCVGATAMPYSPRHVLLHELAHYLTPMAHKEVALPKWWGYLEGQTREKTIDHSDQFWDKMWELCYYYGEFTPDELSHIRWSEGMYYDRSKLSFHRTDGGRLPGPIVELSLSLPQFVAFELAAERLDKRELYTSFAYKNKKWDERYNDNGAWVYMGYAELGSLSDSLTYEPKWSEPMFQKLRELISNAMSNSRSTEWSAIRFITKEEPMTEAASETTLTPEEESEDAALKSAYEEHIEEVQDVKCPDCDEHVELDAIEEPRYECPECGTEFSKSEGNGAGHQCPNCNKFSSRVGMTCPECDGNISPDDAYKPTVETFFKCSTCEEYFDDQEAAFDHVKEEHIEED